MKILKAIFIVIVNILLIIALFFFTDYCVYRYNAHIFYVNHPKIFEINKFKYMPWFPEYFYHLETYFNGKNNIYFGRLPDGLEYKNRLPILLFGCSYAFGQHLEPHQIFSRKLSRQLKRPVYNRGISGGSFQHLYMQSLSEELYKTVPKTDTVIYIMISDHYRRTKLQYFDILDYHAYPHFEVKDNELIMSDYKSDIKNFLRSLYIIKQLNHIYADKVVNNPDNAEMLTDEALVYFIKSREELQKHYGKNFKFYVIFYEDWDIAYSDIMRKKLEDNGFIVISTKDLTDVNLKIPKYTMQDNNHPTEEAWNLLTPLIIKKLGLK